MKKILLYFLITFPLIAQNASEKKVSSEIVDVTVFRQGASVSREAKTQVPKGTTALVFTNLTAQLDPQSVQVAAKGAFTVVSVLHRINYLENATATNEVKQLQQHISAKQDSLQRSAIQQEVLQGEVTLIEANRRQSIGRELNGIKEHGRILSQSFIGN